MKFTNKQICNQALKLINAFNDKDQKMPIKLNFYLQKNKNLIIDTATEIEESRIDILNTFGTISKENPNEYIFSEEVIEQAQKELNDLYALEQDLNIYCIDIENLPEDLVLTTEQMEAILFMCK